ncbi:hypothetical protein [Mycobacterium tuberculosis]
MSVPPSWAAPTPLAKCCSDHLGLTAGNSP